MGLVFNLKEGEFSDKMFEEIIEWLAQHRNGDTPSISTLQTRQEYFAMLDRSIAQLEEGRTITFSAEAFKEYVDKLLKTYNQTSSL